MCPKKFSNIKTIINRYILFSCELSPEFPSTQLQVSCLLQFLVKIETKLHVIYTHLYLSQGGFEKIFTFLFRICNNRFPSHANTSYNPMSNCYIQTFSENKKNYAYLYHRYIRYYLYISLPGNKKKKKRKKIHSNPIIYFYCLDIKQLKIVKYFIIAVNQIIEYYYNNNFLFFNKIMYLEQN